MAVVDRVRGVVLPLLSERSLDLYDIEMSGPVLRVVVDAGGPLDLDVLSDVTRAVSRALDEADPISGRYTLEVTSPGLERTLRTPRHFAGAVGESVRVKVRPGEAEAAEDRRVAGVLTEADDEGIVVRTVGDEGAPVDRRLAYDDIERARTTFEWGPGAKPGGRQAREKRDQRS
ncbi:MAG TPA: ribosome maturation factor RimP [Acidimicrobiales bacterium]|nr:ribosome maturation factor RimP [Acidimicrobiales bacterium]